MSNNVFPCGSIFHVIWDKKNNDLTEDLISEFIMLAQIDANKFLLISLTSGNRWKSTIINGSKGMVEKTKIEKILKLTDNSVNLKSFNLICHCSDIDIFKYLV